MYFAMRNACNPKPTDNHSKSERLWRCIDTDNNKRYWGLHVKCPIFLLDFDKVWILWTELIKIPNIKFRWNPSSGSRTDACGQTDMTKLMIAFRLRRTCLKTHFVGERVVLSFLWWNCSVWLNDL